MVFSRPDAGGAPRTHRRVWVAVAACAALAFISGCSVLGGGQSSSGGSNPNHLETPTIRVGAISAISSAPLYIALRRGYFTQEGLTVQPVVTTGGAQAIPQLISGGLDITLTNDMTAIAAQAKKAADLRFVVDGVQTATNTFSVNSLPGSGVNKLQDLVGKKISVSSPDDIVALSLSRMFQAHTIDAKSVQFVTIPYSETEQALRTHQVDAVTQTEPYTTQTAIDTGAKPVVDVFAEGTSTYQMPNAAYLATTKFAKANPTTIAAFQRAMTRAAGDAADRRTVEQILPTYTKISSQVAALMALPTFPTDLNPVRLQRVVALMQEEKKLSAPFQVSSMIIPVPSS